MTSNSVDAALTNSSGYEFEITNISEQAPIQTSESENGTSEDGSEDQGVENLEPIEEEN